MTDNFTFSQLNFNGDENQRKRSRPTQVTSNTNQTIQNNNNRNNNVHSAMTNYYNPTPINHRENSYLRSLNLSLFISLEVQRSPSFQPSKYISTPLGYINRDFFAAQTPAKILSPHYITFFSTRFFNDASRIISGSDDVLRFVLDIFKQIPCNVPIRWGTFFNFKFRRLFECLTLESWTGLCEVLKTHGYAKSVTRYIHLIDPDFDPSTINTRDNSGSILLQRINQNNQTPPRFQTHRPNNPIITPTRIPTPLIPLVPQSTTPESRPKNNSIYALQLNNSLSPDFADRFSCDLFSFRLEESIRSIYNYNEIHYDSVMNHLRRLPVTIPLRWGVIYNQRLRVRSRSVNRRDGQTTLDQWNKLKDLLKSEGYLDDKSVANCAILINKD